ADTTENHLDGENATLACALRYFNADSSHGIETAHAQMRVADVLRGELDFNDDRFIVGVTGANDPLFEAVSVSVAQIDGPSEIAGLYMPDSVAPPDKASLILAGAITPFDKDGVTYRFVSMACFVGDAETPEAGAGDGASPDAGDDTS